MTHEPPPPPPPAPNDATPSRPWWQFSLRSLMIVMTGFAVFLAVLVILPELAAVVVHAAVIGLVGGLFAGAAFHDFDEARLAATGAAASVSIAIASPSSAFATSAVESMLRKLPEFSSELAYVLMTLLGVTSIPAMMFLAAAFGAFSAVKSAPRWHRWAVRNR